MELVETTVHVADDVEWSMLVFAIVPEWLAFDHDCVDVFRRGQFVNVAKAFALQVANRAPQLLLLLSNDVRTEVAIRPLTVSIFTEPDREVQNNRNWKHVILACERNERLT